MPTHTITHNVKTDTGVNVATSSYQVSASGEAYASTTVPAGTTNAEIDLAAIAANLKSVVLWSDQDVTVKTNSTGSPANTFALVAKQAIAWDTNQLPQYVCPITTDVTKLYVTNAGTKDAVVKFVFLSDITPTITD